MINSRICRLEARKKLADKLLGSIDQIKLARELATIVTDIDVMPVPNDITWQGIQVQAFDLFAEEMGFGNVFTARVADLKHRPITSNFRV